jgi:hypothetical protein
MNRDADLLTLGQAADELRTQTWKLQRLYVRGLLPEPKRVGRNRVIRPDELPAIACALAAAGYLKTTDPQTLVG